MADNKIEESEFFLDQIRATYPRKEMRHHLSAFLSASKSIADHLLEEYNQKLGLNIPLTNKLTISIFEQSARQQNNQKAILFITLFKQELQNVQNDPVGNFLLNKRNINVHRTINDKPLHAEITVKETLHISDSVTVTVFDKDGNIKRSSTSPPNPPMPKPAEPSSEIKYFFSDYMTDDIPTVCDKFLSLMKGFVANMRSQFP